MRKAVTRPKEQFTGTDPHAAFGVARGTDGETVGPMQPRSVQFGRWSWSFHGPFPMLLLNFNKYNAHLPPWRDVVEVALLDESAGVALAHVAQYLGAEVSGKLKTAQIGASRVSWDLDDATIISPEDVLRTESDASQGTSDFKVTETLE